MAFTSLFLTTLTLTGCSDETQIEADTLTDSAGSSSDVFDAKSLREPVSLVTAKDWRLLSAAQDPYTDRITNVNCAEPDGFGTEDLDGTEVFAIDMVFCNYATVSQPLLAELVPGDQVSFRIWHFELTGDTPAHISL